MELQSKVEDTELSSPWNSNAAAAAAAAVEFAVNKMNQALPNLFSELDRAKCEIEKKSKEIYHWGERVKFEELDRKMVERELREEIEKLATQNEEMKKNEERYLKSMEQLATENREMKEKGEKYDKSLKALESQKRRIRDVLEEIEELRDELKKKDERYEKPSEELRRKIGELGEKLKKSEEECERRKKEAEMLLEAGKRKEKKDGETILELKGKIRELEDENREYEQIWKATFMGLDERVLRLGNDVQALKKEADCGGSRGNSKNGASDKRDTTSPNGLAPLSKAAAADVNDSLKRKFESRNIVDGYDIYASSTSSSSSSECDREEILRSCSRLLGDSVHQSKKK